MIERKTWSNLLKWSGWLLAMGHHISFAPHTYIRMFMTTTQTASSERETQLKNKVSNGAKLFFGGDVRIMPDLVERLAKQEGTDPQWFSLSAY